MTTRKSRTHLALVFAAAAIGCSGSARAQSCSMVTLDEPGAYQRNQALAMRLFPIKTAPNYKAGEVEDLRIHMAEELKKSLTATKFFRSVDIVKENESPQGAYLLEGEFLQIDQGSRQIPAIARLATVGVHARLFGGAKYSVLVAEFECVGHGEWFGAKGATKDSIDRIAWGLARRVVKAEKTAAKVASAKGTDTMLGEAPGGSRAVALLSPALAGVKRIPGIHRKSKQEDSAEVLDPEDENGDIEADPKRKDEEKKFLTTLVRARKRRSIRELDAVWFTDPVYQAQVKLVGLVTTPKDDLRGRTLRGGLLPSNQHLRAFEGQPVFVIAASYDKLMNQSPIVWNKEQVKYTKLRGAGGRTVTPVTTIDPSCTPSIISKGKANFKVQFVSRPVIFAFPATLPGGEPLVSSLDETVELQTQFEGTQVTLRFDLRSFGLRDVSDLRLKPRTKTAGL
jgi:hypothetical protein